MLRRNEIFFCFHFLCNIPLLINFLYGMGVTEGITSHPPAEIQTAVFATFRKMQKSPDCGPQKGNKSSQ